MGILYICAGLLLIVLGVFIIYRDNKKHARAMKDISSETRNKLLYWLVALSRPRAFF